MYVCMCVCVCEGHRDWQEEKAGETRIDSGCSPPALSLPPSAEKEGQRAPLPLLFALPHPERPLLLRSLYRLLPPSFAPAWENDTPTGKGKAQRQGEKRGKKGGRVYIGRGEERKREGGREAGKEGEGEGGRACKTASTETTGRRRKDPLTPFGKKNKENHKGNRPQQVLSSSGSAYGSPSAYLPPTCKCCCGCNGGCGCDWG